MVIFISIYIVKVGTGKLLLLHSDLYFYLIFKVETGKLSVLHGDLYFYLHCQSGQVSCYYYIVIFISISFSKSRQVSCHYYMVIFISIYIVSRDR